MAKKLKKTSAASTAASQQEDDIWTLARQFGTPVDYKKRWAETATSSVCVPRRLLFYARDSQVLPTDRPRVQAPCFVLINVLKGAGQICLDERIFKLDVGQALLIFPFQFRHFIFPPEGPIRWVFISFDMSHADSLEFRRNRPWQLAPESTQILRHLLEAGSFQNSTCAKRETEAQLWLALFLNQNSSQEMTPLSSSPTMFAEKQKWREHIHTYLYRHLDQPLKLEDIAHGVGYSKSHLRHQFKEHFKMSLGHYVAQIRISRAASLLRENVLNISGVAQACGYSSVYIFSRAFRAGMGCSPLHYRSQMHKGTTER